MAAAPAITTTTPCTETPIQKWILAFVCCVSLIPSFSSSFQLFVAFVVSFFSLSFSTLLRFSSCSVNEFIVCSCLNMFMYEFVMFACFISHSKTRILVRNNVQCTYTVYYTLVRAVEHTAGVRSTMNELLWKGTKTYSIWMRNEENNAHTVSFDGMSMYVCLTYAFILHRHIDSIDHALWQSMCRCVSHSYTWNDTNNSKTHLYHYTIMTNNNNNIRPFVEWSFAFIDPYSIEFFNSIDYCHTHTMNSNNTSFLLPSTDLIFLLCFYLVFVSFSMANRFLN